MKGTSMKEGNGTCRVHTIYERRESDHERGERESPTWSDAARWAADVARRQGAAESGQTERSGSGQERTGKGTIQGQWGVPLQSSGLGGPMLCASLSHPAWDRLPQPEPSDLPEKNFIQGESIETFFARRARRCEMLEARETEKKRSTRLNWVFEANKGHSLKHSKLYEWHHVVHGDRTSPLT